MHMQGSGHPSMVPVAAAAARGRAADAVTDSALVIPIVAFGDDVRLLDHIGFVGIAILGQVVGQVLGVQAGLVGIDGPALIRGVAFRCFVGREAAFVVRHDLQPFLTGF